MLSPATTPRGGNHESRDHHQNSGAQNNAAQCSFHLIERNGQGFPVQQDGQKDRQNHLVGEADGADVRNESCGDAHQDEGDGADQVETASESRADDDRNAQNDDDFKRHRGSLYIGRRWGGNSLPVLPLERSVS